MSKIETDNFEITPEPFAPAQVIAGCCDILALRAREAGVQLDRLVPGDLPDIVADKRALNQILLNLLSNAIRFTDRGGKVTISARAEAGSITFVVEDNGVGISDEDLARVGEPYFQAGASYDRRHGGTGLGPFHRQGPGAAARRRILDPQPGRRGHARHVAPAARLRTVAAGEKAPPWRGQSDRHCGETAGRCCGRTAGKRGEEKCVSAVTMKPRQRARGDARRIIRIAAVDAAYRPAGQFFRHSRRSGGDHRDRRQCGFPAIGRAAGTVRRQSDIAEDGRRGAKARGADRAADHRYERYAYSDRTAAAANRTDAGAVATAQRSDRRPDRAVTAHHGGAARALELRLRPDQAVRHAR